MRPKEMLSSSTFYFLFAALFCCSFYANMFYNLYKVGVHGSFVVQSVGILSSRFPIPSEICELGDI
ncbi:unnamed protein product [Nippostrongylus brasiliensis]|uniref:Secreted protein n=1 Tax=Nippostrongylus brasiliensis TaxID=27835 RepID=A0A0N4YZW0_NIPBR|nr:unnamed protein product [Nippostrongylus brasiliensis]